MLPIVACTTEDRLGLASWSNRDMDTARLPCRGVDLGVVAPSRTRRGVIAGMRSVRRRFANPVAADAVPGVVVVENMDADIIAPSSPACDGGWAGQR